MKKALVFGILISIIAPILAQQHPIYTQYQLNRFAINPALAGVLPCGEAIVGNRRQWIGFEGAPRTYYSSFNTRVNKKDKYPKNYHGWGINIIADRLGQLEYNYIKGAYAYHVKLSRNFRASMGVFLGIHQSKRNFSGIRAQGKGIDPALNSDEKEQGLFYPEISPGGYLYNKNFYLGLSILQIFPTKMEIYGSEENRFTAHYFLSSGYRLRGKNLHYIPSFLFSFSPLVSPTADISLRIEYPHVIGVALGSKYLNSGYALFEVTASKSLSFSYSYEYALNEINNVAPVTHEVAIRYRRCSDTKIPKEEFFCPAYK